jgi:adenine C2-methylase RlmN of 23S rRNA A2503 and tRNA A37
MEEQKKIKVLKQFFAISVAAFEMQHSISKAFGYLGTKSYMNLLHLNAQEEINKEKPSLEKMDKFLAMMEEAAKDYSRPTPNFPKGTD